MIIIADSGATKTNWIISGEGEVKNRIQTTGLNPNFSSAHQIMSVIHENISPLAEPGQQHEIHFYGSGCSGDFLCNKVSKAISRIFPGSIVEVNGDLLGAARALLGNNMGIACILGTGSNSCLYDGEKIISNIPPLGFILGDEGSGASLGKQLLADYLKGIMPAEVAKLFGKEFATDKDKVIKEVYRGEFPSKYIASFVVFLRENLNKDYCKKLLIASFEDFIERNIMHYDGYKEMKISFTGSIAWYFKVILLKVLKEAGLKAGEVIKEPAERIMDYHLRKE
ncbi:MAG: ATPase [Bacteroidales bacterium]|nr:ATPase [Bacteroidales bacterium]